jgi:glycosyltransferase involved in cell wall biosynthesis
MLKSYHILPSRLKKYKKIEKEVLQNADLCLTTSKVWAEDFKRLGAKRISTITNGFDEDDFQEKVENYNDFVISHFGLLNHLRNPKNLWQALDELCSGNAEFKTRLKIHLGGTIDPQNLTEINSYRHLAGKVKTFPYLNHKEVIKEYGKSSLLLLLLFNSDSGKGNIPGKLFEYLASNKPIIAFGSASGDSESIIKESNAGAFFKYDSSIQSIKDYLLKAFNKNDMDLDFSITSSTYSRKNITKKLSEVLEELCLNDVR